MSKQVNSTNIIGVKELRQNLDKYVKAIQKGQSFTVVRRSKPIFSMQKPVTYDEWGDPAGEWASGVDLRDDAGRGISSEEFLDLLASALNKQKHDRQNPKVSQ